MIHRAIGLLLLAPLAGFGLEAALGAGDFELPLRAWGLTLIVAGTATALSLAFGIPAAMTLAHGRGLGLTLLPLFIPPALAGSVWMALRLPFPGPWGCGAILAAVSWPLVALLTAASLRNLPRAALEAAELAGASPVRTVVWPHVRPTVAAAAGLVFLLSASEFTVPSTFAVPTVPYILFTHLNAFRYGTAAAVALPLMVLAVAVAMAMRKIPGATAAGELRPFLKKRTVAVCAFLTVLIQGATTLAPAAVWLLTIRNFSAFGTGLALHAGSVAWSVAFSAIVGLVLAAWASFSRGRSALEPLWILTLLLPGVATALGTLSLSARLGVLDLLSGAGGLLILALLGRYAAVAAVGLRGAVERTQIEAAQLAGLSRWRTWWTVVRPALLPRAAAVAGVVFALSLGDVACAEFLSPPGRQTAVRQIFSLMHFGYDETVAALALSLFGLAALAAWGIAYVGRVGRASVAR